MEPEGSSPHSQVPTTWSYPKLQQSSPCLPIPLPEDPLYIILPFVPRSSKWPLSVPKPCMHHSCLHTCHIDKTYTLITDLLHRVTHLFWLPLPTVWLWANNVGTPGTKAGVQAAEWAGTLQDLNKKTRPPLLLLHPVPCTSDVIT